MRILTGVGVVALIVLCVLRRHDLAAAAVAVPPQALGALAALHLTTLVARSEAWRLSLAAIAGTPPSRAAIHAANAGAFVAGALEPHAALPARVDPPAPARSPPAAPPHPPRGRRHADPAARGGGRPRHPGVERRSYPLMTWKDRRSTLRAPPAPGPAALGARQRIAADVDSRGQRRHPNIALALGVSGLLPLGPSAPPGALLVVSGGAGAGALAAGLALSATSIVAVLAYAGALALAAR